MWTAMLILGGATAVLAAPHIQNYRQDPFVTETPCNNDTSTTTTTTDVYDQRQNGTENYRINVNGVVVLLAPAETLLAAANMHNLEEEMAGMKPPPKATTTTTTDRPVTTAAAASAAEVTHAASVATVDPCEGGRCILSSNSTVKQRGKLKMMNNIIQLFRNLRDEAPRA